MYYGSRAIMAKLQPSDRVYLYNNGDECTSVTGGWTVTGANITKNPTNIQLGSAASTGRSIKTVNNISFGTNDCLFVKLMTTGSTSTYSFSLLRGSTRMYNNVVSGRNQINQNNFTPNAEKLVMFYDPTAFNDIITILNNFGVWYIYEIWIDRYDF